ncbi:MAG: DUF1232 domain-containing protein [Paludibacteraceae bacterium]|nr:DUF1232 domain-containing protein [Paludibacteraceae bacterium]
MKEERYEEEPKSQIEEYGEHYSPQELFFKLARVAKNAGIKIVYYVLILYYSLMYGNLTVKEKSIIIGALGYFILPIDLIPDLLPLGYSDDLSLIVFVVTKMKKSFTEEIRTMALNKLKRYFDNIDEDAISLK